MPVLLVKIWMCWILRYSALIKVTVGALQNTEKIITANTPSWKLSGPFFRMIPFHNLTVSQHRATLPTHANVISETVSIDEECISMPLYLCGDALGFFFFFSKTFKGIHQYYFQRAVSLWDFMCGIWNTLEWWIFICLFSLTWVTVY